MTSNLPKECQDGKPERTISENKMSCSEMQTKCSIQFHIVGRDKQEEEVIKKLMNIRELREIAITTNVLSNREQDIPDGTEEKIKDNRDPNSETKQTLRQEMKPIIENMYHRAEVTKRGFITMQEIHDECSSSSNQYTKKHIHSVSSRIREWVRLGMMQRITFNGKEIEGHYQIVWKVWNKDFSKKIPEKT